MSRYVPTLLKKLVFERANFRCEYCRLPAYFSLLSFEIEHIISLKHGGKTIFENLACSCPICNAFKGTDLATLLEGEIIPLFHPRNQNWDDHFLMRNGEILAKTRVGEATIKLLKLNSPVRVAERLEAAGFNIF